ncbi:MAG: FecR domain-containing protein [Tannerella sp.]|jgi:ferric-dicitrate binding protein FerR (iron transport regulator)|nr:FecR domain-containing protein [Tannerella sp.]
MERHIPWELLISHLNHETNADEEAVLTQWRRTDANELMYRDIASLWDEIRHEASAYEPDRDYYWKKLEARLNAMERQKEARLTVPLRRLRAAVAVAATLLVIVVAGAYLLGTTRTKRETGVQTCRAVSGKTQLVLPDGSLVWLNLGSTLTYETPFTHRREVTLGGEALFEVRKDGSHPFTVRADDVSITVLGTRFNVHAYAEEADIRVALLDGAVHVEADGKARDMAPGDVVAFDRETHLLTVMESDADVESCWANSACSFEAKTLGYICRRLERWYNVDIRLDASIAEAQTYTFTVTDEPLETVLQIMSRINPLRYSFDGERTVTISQVKHLKH